MAWKLAALWCEPPILGGNWEGERAYQHPRHRIAFTATTKKLGFPPNFTVGFNQPFDDEQFTIVEEWVRENCSGNHVVFYSGEAHFENETDAMLCYLRFV